MACFSEQMRPICTSPLSESANTCGRSMAVSVMPSSWNCFWSGWLRAMMKNQGPSGDAWMWVAWICAVDALLLRRQLVEVELGGRRQRLDDVLQRVLVDAVPQVEELHRDLGVGEELLADVALPQVLADRVVVGEVAVVDQRLVQPDERVRAARVPHAALGGIALVGDPDVGLEILELVVLHVLLGVAHQLEDQQVSRVREHEGALLAQRGVEGVVEPVGVAPDELVLQRRAARGPAGPSVSAKALQHVRLDPHHVAVHVRRPDLQARDVAIVVDVRLPRGEGDVEVGQDELPLQLGVAVGIEQGDLQQVVAVEHLARRRPAARAPGPRPRCRRPCRCRGSASAWRARR